MQNIPHKIKILYAEDQVSVQNFVRVLFEANNINDVVIVSNGKEALDLYVDSNFDLVITDMFMPIMDGFELIENIKKINPKQTFMMLTGLERKEDLIRAIDLRVNFFIQKPIQANKFNQVLQESIEYVNIKKEAALAHTLLTQYKQAIDASTILSKADLSGNITYVNKAFCEISKYSQAELLGISHRILRHPDMDSSLFKDMWSTITSKRQWKGKIKNLAKDGSEYIVDALIIPLLDSDNNIIEYLGIRHDITKLANYQENLEKQLKIAVKDIVDTQKEVVYTMGSIGETRSKETGFHVKRVAEYSYHLAKLYGMSEDESELLKLASPMHDIGKVGISDDILNKPGKLTYEEFEIMKTHAELGYDMLKNSDKDILKASATVAYEHHEKWDGTGYPRGLKEEETHIYGRITAICDVFDALSHNRVYKKAWPIEDITQLFKRERAKHFDPALIDLFLNNLDDFLIIKNTYEDIP